MLGYKASLAQVEYAINNERLKPTNVAIKNPPNATEAVGMMLPVNKPQLSKTATAIALGRGRIDFG